MNFFHQESVMDFFLQGVQVWNQEQYFLKLSQKYVWQYAFYVSYCVYSSDSLLDFSSYHQHKINSSSLFHAPNVHSAIYHGKNESWSTMIKYLTIIALLYSETECLSSVYYFCFVSICSGWNKCNVRKKLTGHFNFNGPCIWSYN